MRRVGSTTLGISLIALGIFFILYYFFPGFDWLLAAKLSPVLVIALGVEVLVCSFRPGQSRYDFLAILSCLLVMCACFGVTLLPLVWEYAGPGRSAARAALTSQYEAELYGALRKDKTGALTLDDLHVWLDLPFSGQTPEKLEEIGPEATLGASVSLAGPYESKQDFAADCRRVMDAVQEQKIWTNYLQIRYTDADGWGYALYLDSMVQLDWDTGRIAQDVEDGRAEWEQEQREEREALAAEQAALEAEQAAA